MKAEIEIVWNNDGSVFVNYWDHLGGHDMCYQLDSKGMLTDISDGVEAISFSDFIVLVEERKSFEE